MRKVMIVDDEKWVRRGLIQSIPWESLGLTLCGEAGDGQDALDMALERKPELLFLDMRMPGLDGKELLALLAGAMPGLLTIVVSGYSDFEYTKQAIRCQAFDYLLKPVKREELASVLEKALAELERRERRSADEEAEWLRRLLLEEAEADAGFPEAPPAWAGQTAAAFALQADRYAADGGRSAALLRRLREKCAREHAFYFGGSWRIALAPPPDGRHEAAGAVAAPQLAAAELDRLLRMLQAEAKRLDHAGISVGVSEPGPAGAGFLRRGYAEAAQALGRRKLSEREAIVHAAHAARRGAALPPYPQERERALLLALQLGSREAAEREFDRLLASLCRPEATVDQLQRGAALLVHSLEKQLRASESASLESVCGRHPHALAEELRLRPDADSVRELFAGELIPALLSGRERHGRAEGERIVREAQRLIEAFYDQPLSLQHIAESRFVNPDYLSRLFKKTTGHSFVDYLADCRIRKSMELMKVPAYKNYEIARKVGYEDYRYFSQIFKKRTGKTIGEYRSDSGCAKS